MGGGCQRLCMKLSVRFPMSVHCASLLVSQTLQPQRGAGVPEAGCRPTGEEVPVSDQGKRVLCGRIVFIFQWSISWYMLLQGTAQRLTMYQATGLRLSFFFSLMYFCGGRISPENMKSYTLRRKAQPDLSGQQSCCRSRCPGFL